MKKVNLLISVFLLALLSAYSMLQPCLFAKTTKAISTASRVAAKNRPRVVYFYANWCGVCQHYGPTLKSTVYAYRNYVDFQSFNVDDPNNRSLVSRFQIHSIPATYIYNSQGQRVFEQTGPVNQQSLYKVLKSVYMEMAVKPAKTSKPNQKTSAATKAPK